MTLLHTQNTNCKIVCIKFNSAAYLRRLRTLRVFHLQCEKCHPFLGLLILLQAFMKQSWGTSNQFVQFVQIPINKIPAGSCSEILPFCLNSTDTRGKSKRHRWERSRWCNDFTADTDRRLAWLHHMNTTSSTFCTLWCCICSPTNYLKARNLPAFKHLVFFTCKSSSLFPIYFFPFLQVSVDIVVFNNI